MLTYVIEGLSLLMFIGRSNLLAALAKLSHSHAKQPYVTNGTFLFVDRPWSKQKMCATRNIIPADYITPHHTITHIYQNMIPHEISRLLNSLY